MLHGTYIGIDSKLKMQEALLIRVDKSFFKAQFDNYNLGPEYSHSWKMFEATDFILDDNIEG